MSSHLLHDLAGCKAKVSLLSPQLQHYDLLPAPFLHQTLVRSLSQHYSSHLLCQTSAQPAASAPISMMSTKLATSLHKHATPSDQQSLTWCKCFPGPEQWTDPAALGSARAGPKGPRRVEPAMTLPASCGLAPLSATQACPISSMLKGQHRACAHSSLWGSPQQLVLDPANAHSMNTSSATGDAWVLCPCPAPNHRLSGYGPVIAAELTHSFCRRGAGGPAHGFLTAAQASSSRRQPRLWQVIRCACSLWGPRA